MARDVRMSELIEANPTFEQQMRDWQTERHHRGENPFDWESFRSVAQYMGACDPGTDPPMEFFWFTSPEGGMMTAPSVDVPAATGASKVPSARLVSPGKDRGTGGSGEALTEVKYWR
ncbi:MAG: hypothetical protein AB7P40_05795 [Chloroflexota bacterium]